MNAKLHTTMSAVTVSALGGIDRHSSSTASVSSPTSSAP